MANINLIRFNGTESQWAAKKETSAYLDGVVFAKIWNDAVTPQTCRYVIYAGKDAYNAEYTYEVHTMDRLEKIEALLSLDSSLNFTDTSFRTALENYINDSAAINDIRDMITLIDTSIDEITDVVGEHETRIGNTEADVELHENRLDGIDSSIEGITEIDKVQDSRLDTAEGGIGVLNSSVNDHNVRLNGIDSSISDIDELNKVQDSRLDTAEGGIGVLNSSVNTHDTRLGDHDTKFVEVDSSIETLESEVKTQEGVVSAK